MSVGAFVLGILNGLLIGLLAVGLVLVYKSNRFLNLAHAQLGTLSALLLGKFVLDWHWSWWVAFVVVVGVGVLTEVVLGGDHVLVAILAPVLVAILGAFLAWSTLGKTIRAAATNPDEARLCG